MRKYYIFIVVLGILVVGLIIAGFMEIGSPLSRREIALDSQRMLAFSTISSEIQYYFEENNKLPNTLSEVKLLTAKTLLDAESNKQYVYTKLSDTTYNLCATFSTDSKKTQEKLKNMGKTSYEDEYYYDYGKKQHKKGYDCIEYNINDDEYYDYGYDEYYDGATPTPADVDQSIKNISPNVSLTLATNGLNVTLNNAYLSTIYDDYPSPKNEKYLFLEFVVRNTSNTDYEVMGSDFVRMEKDGLLSAPTDGYGESALKRTDIKVYSAFKVSVLDNSFKVLFGDLNNPQTINLDFSKAKVLKGYLYSDQGFSETQRTNY